MKFQQKPHIEIPQWALDLGFEDESWKNDGAARLTKTLPNGQVLVIWVAENDPKDRDNDLITDKYMIEIMKDHDAYGDVDGVMFLGSAPTDAEAEKIVRSALNESAPAGEVLKEAPEQEDYGLMGYGIQCDAFWMPKKDEFRIDSGWSEDESTAHVFATKEEAQACVDKCPVGKRGCVGPENLEIVPLYYDYEGALNDALDMLDDSEQLEPTSALKQAASDKGIPYGPEMGKFVEWARKQLFEATVRNDPAQDHTGSLRSTEDHLKDERWTEHQTGKRVQGLPYKGYTIVWNDNQDNFHLMKGSPGKRGGFSKMKSMGGYRSVAAAMLAVDALERERQQFGESLDHFGMPLLEGSSQSKITVTLGSVTNPDMDRESKNLKPVDVEVPSVQAAIQAAREYIAKHDLGGGNWVGMGTIKMSGKPVARVSYNGRLWTLDDKSISPEDLD